MFVVMDVKDAEARLCLHPAENMVHVHLTGFTQPVALASNCRAEVWQLHDGGKVLLGYIGDRSDGSKMFSRQFLRAASPAWDAEPGAPPPPPCPALSAVSLLVRMHWVRDRDRDRDGNRDQDRKRVGPTPAFTTLTCRPTTAQPLLWVDDTRVRARAMLEVGYVVGERSCSQLPRQAGYFCPRGGPRTRLQLWCHASAEGVSIVPSPLQALRVVPVHGAALVSKTLVGVAAMAFAAFAAGTHKVPSLQKISALEGCLERLPCLHSLVMDNCGALMHWVMDLGANGPHRFVVSTVHGGPCVLLFAEVETLQAMRTPKRAKAKLAAFVASRTTAPLFGYQGCRYLHVFQDAAGVAAGPPPRIMGFRLQYPLPWARVSTAAAPGQDPLFGVLKAAVVATLRACVHGEAVVNSAWREQTQWTGDAVVVLRALAALNLDADGAVSRHVAALIADTYNPELGMVAAVCPVPAHACLFVPSFHLLFCMLAWQLAGDSVLPARARRAIRHSMDTWRAKYVQADGTLVVPTHALRPAARVWHFIDWAADVACLDAASARGMQCNSVLTALWVQLHALQAQQPGQRTGSGGGSGSLASSGIDGVRFQAMFACASVPGAYSVRAFSGVPSVHATANAILAGLTADPAASATALQTLLERWWRCASPGPDDPRHGGPTAYYGGFVCDALQVCADAGLAPRHAALAAALQMYGPSAAAHGTLLERRVGVGSLAQAGSVGVAQILWGSTPLTRRLFVQ